MIITMRHIRAAKMCAPGVKTFFERHNLDLRKFRKEGLPEEVIAKTGDAMALRVIKVAHGRR